MEKHAAEVGEDDPCRGSVVAISTTKYFKEEMMESIAIAVINESNNPLPEYATEGSSGMDIRAFINEPIELQPLQRALIATGLFLELPNGYEAQIRPRSGLALKQGITVLNTPGTIDADYRGEVKVILINLSTETVTVNSGERIAQMVFQRVENATWVEALAINETARGNGGFGHTGKV